MTRYIPSPDELSEAITERNSVLLAKFAVDLDADRTELEAALPDKIAAFSNAKRDLDMLKAVISNRKSTLSTIKSLLYERRGV